MTKIKNSKKTSEPAADSWLVLQTLPGISPERIERLLATFGGPQEALNAPSSDFTRIAGKRANEALRREAVEGIARRLRRQAEKEGAYCLTRSDPDYPKALRNIFAPPGALFIKGTLQRADALAIAIVGMRRPSPYGRRMARKLAGGLAARGFTIVSGLAYGIDAEAHEAALEAGGRTVAILGCGLGKTYPADHGPLRRQIAEQGAVVSEFSWDEPPRPMNFPRRNRLISGLSLVTIVVEAAERSGALLTARLALEQGREVMAVPGPADSGRSTGCHRLLKQGAHLVEETEDVLAALPEYLADALPGRGKSSPPPAAPERGAPEAAPLPPEEESLLSLLAGGEHSIEGLTQAQGRSPEEVSGALLRLEIKGLVRQTAAGLYTKV